MPRFTAILTGVLRRNTRSKVTIQSIGILQPCRKGNKTVNCGKLIFTNNGVTWIWVQVFNLCCGILNRSIPYTLRLFCNSLEMTSKCGENLKVAQPSVSLMILPHFDVLCGGKRQTLPLREFYPECLVRFWLKEFTKSRTSTSAVHCLQDSFSETSHHQEE